MPAGDSAAGTSASLCPFGQQPTGARARWYHGGLPGHHASVYRSPFPPLLSLMDPAASQRALQVRQRHAG